MKKPIAAAIPAIIVGGAALIAGSQLGNGLLMLLGFGFCIAIVAHFFVAMTKAEAQAKFEAGEKPWKPRPDATIDHSEIEAANPEMRQDTDR